MVSLLARTSSSSTDSLIPVSLTIPLPTRKSFHRISKRAFELIGGEGRHSRVVPVNGKRQTDIFILKSGKSTTAPMIDATYGRIFKTLLKAFSVLSEIMQQTGKTCLHLPFRREQRIARPISPTLRKCVESNCQRDLFGSRSPSSCFRCMGVIVHKLGNYIRKCPKRADHATSKLG